MIHDKAFDFFVILLKNFYPNDLFWNLMTIIESIQFFSYIYNSLYVFSGESYNIIKYFSDVSTYFRVYYWITLDLQTH